MNLKLLMGVGLFAVSGALAQDFGASEATSENMAPTATESPVAFAPAPAPVASSSSFASVANFDQLRGNAYNFVGNEAAAYTVNDYLARPHLFGGTQLLYIEPTGESGLVSWGSNTTLFLGLDNSQNLGLMTLGIAKKNAWGLDLNLALGQTSETVDNDGKTTTSTTEAGDDWGVKFSMVMGSYILAASVDWLTTADQVNLDPATGSETTQDYWDLTLNANLNNAPGAKSVSWTLGLNVLRHVESVDNGATTTVTEDTRTEIAPYFNLGSKILGNERARVFIGSNNSIPVQIFDGYDNSGISKSHFETGLIINPNIFGELALTENVLLFGGATHSLLVFGYKGVSTDYGTSTTDESTVQSKTGTTIATMGFRFQKDRYAAEFNLADEVFSDAGEIFNGEETFVSFGGFIYF